MAGKSVSFRLMRVGNSDLQTREPGRVRAAAGLASEDTSKQLSCVAPLFHIPQ